MKFVGIDPSTKTGVVILDEAGNVTIEHEIKSPIKDDPPRMIYITNSIKRFLEHDSFYVCIEGFSFNSIGQRADFQYGLGWLIRSMLYTRKIDYIDVAPNELKGFVGVTGFKGEKGKRVRLTGKEKKQAVADAVESMWGYKNKSDNIIDAYVLAQMALQKFGGAK